MKKLLLALALLTGGAAHAQITYEARYGANLQPFKLSTGQVKYIGFFPASNSIRIYNNDNSLYKAVALPNGANYAYSSFFYLSDNLFNADSKLEFATSIGANNNFTMKVLNEDGVQLFSQDSCTNAEIYNTPLGAKMFARIYRVGGGEYYKVYALPGKSIPLALKAATAVLTNQPYPNPTTAQIQLPYQLSTGQIGTLTVTNVAGQQVARYTVDSTFNNLKFDTSTLSKGVYLYQVATTTERSAAQRFVVE